MTDRTITKDAGSGQFVSADYAAEHPDTTYTQPGATPDRLSEALDGIEAAGWDWTLYFHREPEKLPSGTHRYELEAWRQPAGYLRLGGPTKPEAAEAVLAALADLPEPVEEPVEPGPANADSLDGVVVDERVGSTNDDLPVVEPVATSGSA